jgi:hypothetical protein
VLELPMQLQGKLGATKTACRQHYTDLAQRRADVALLGRAFSYELCQYEVNLLLEVLCCANFQLLKAGNSSPSLNALLKEVRFRVRSKAASTLRRQHDRASSKVLHLNTF